MRSVSKQQLFAIFILETSRNLMTTRECFLAFISRYALKDINVQIIAFQDITLKPKREALGGCNRDIQYLATSAYSVKHFDPKLPLQLDSLMQNDYLFISG